MIRYSVITEKNPREIVLLRGSGCEWRRCRFCDYHLDFSKNENENFALNREVLSRVTGEYHSLEVINSGSFTNLDGETMNLIKKICRDCNVQSLRFECHWKSRESIAPAKKEFASLGVTLKIKMGVETFDELFRECYLDKGMEGAKPEDIAAYADEVCLLQGIPGQTTESMISDIETGLEYFERVCVNVMNTNTSRIKPDPAVISSFLKNVAPRYEKNERVDILTANTDFGVGGTN